MFTILHIFGFAMVQKNIVSHSFHNAIQVLISFPHFKIAPDITITTRHFVARAVLKSDGKYLLAIQEQSCETC